MAAALGPADSFSIESVGSGHEALRRLDRDPLPNAVVIERDLPDLNGFELAGRIKDAPGLDGTNTLILASRDEDGAAASSAEQVCDAYFLKEDAGARGSLAALAVRLFAA